jgi:hypothetical protein
MKLIRLNDNTIVSLENVRTVTPEATDPRITRTIYHSIKIEYCDGAHYTISCGTNDIGAESVKAIIEKIFEILSKTP